VRELKVGGSSRGNSPLLNRVAKSHGFGVFLGRAIPATRAANVFPGGRSAGTVGAPKGFPDRTTGPVGFGVVAPVGTLGVGASFATGTTRGVGLSASFRDLGRAMRQFYEGKRQRIRAPSPAI